MLDNKAQVSKVFVFVFSTIVILFAAFLVVKFVSAFLDDSTQIYEKKFFDLVEKNYDSVLKTYGSEKVYNYKVSNRIQHICFVSNKDCIDTLDMIDNITYPNGKTNMKLVVENGDNIILFDKESLLESKKIGQFTVKNTGCFCENPGSSQWFKILMQNNRNTVMIDQIAHFN